METKGAHLSGGDALHRLYQPGVWRAIHLLLSFLSVHARENERADVCDLTLQ